MDPEKLDVRVTAAVVEFRKGSERPPIPGPAFFTPIRPKNAPPDHRKYVEWTPSRIVQWAGQPPSHGAPLKNWPHALIQSKIVLALVEELTGLTGFGLDIKSVRSILARGLIDRQAQFRLSPKTSLPFHDNVRGGNISNKNKENTNAQ